jgi:hypothetical protein
VDCDLGNFIANWDIVPPLQLTEEKAPVVVRAFKTMEPPPLIKMSASDV